MDESTTDESGKQFAPLPNSSHFFVVVGRNVDQWRASLGLEEGIPWGRPRQRSHSVLEHGTRAWYSLDTNVHRPSFKVPILEFGHGAGARVALK